MPFDENLWKKFLSPISINSFPHLDCPSCGARALILNSKNIRYHRLKNQYEGRRFEHEDFGSSVVAKIFGALAFVAAELNWEQCRFNGHLVCDFCGEITSVLGKAKIPSATAKAQGTVLSEQLMPEFFSPAIPIIPLAVDYPIALRQELGRSFAMFFSDASSAGNRIRTCVELLLDDLNVERFLPDCNGGVKISSSGKKMPLSLGKRIEAFSHHHADYAKMLKAIKGVGNEGSHSSELSRQDLLMAYKIINYVLTSIYIKSKQHTEILKITNELENKYS